VDREITFDNCVRKNTSDRDDTFELQRAKKGVLAHNRAIDLELDSVLHV
jgi:hypothetical protein